IVEGMRAVVRAGAEVVLVVRGGGSFEDLMPFNDEGLARMIAKCPVPVVTGIGHEPDTSIADMVADLRASTPTAAAEAVSPARESLGRLFEARSSSLRASMSRALDRAGAEVRRCATRPLFCDAQLLYATEAQMLDLASDRLFRALPANLARDEASVARQRERLACALPASLDRSRTRLEHERERLASCGGALVPRFGQQAALAAARLHDLSPLAVLGRGYAIARTEDGAVVKSVEAAPPGTAVDVAVADGVLACRVEQARRVDTEIIDWEDAS
ncbi:exodeoxyribonuclease VII large subunit, partial [Eggerthella lenta]